MSWVPFNYDVILRNITSPNNLFSNLYFENFIVRLQVLYILHMHAIFHAN